MAGQSEPTVDELIKELPAVSESLVIKLALGVPPDIEAQILVSKNLRPLQAETKRLVVKFQSQIHSYRVAIQGGSKPDLAWRKRTDAIHLKLTTLLMRLNALIKEENRRESTYRYSRNHALREAIKTHREAVKSFAHGPSQADLSLWATLGDQECVS